MHDSLRESETARTARLEREGRLDAFRARCSELKRGAKTKAERSAAWQQAVAEFAPPAASPPSPADLLPLASFADRSAPPAAVIEWVAAHLSLDAKASDAPSSAAWGLLQWARQDPGQFWRQLYPGILPTRQQLERDRERFTDDGAHIDVVLDRFVRALEAQRAADAEFDPFDNDERTAP